MELMSSWPMLIPLNQHGTSYHGMICISGEEFEISVELSDRNHMRGAKFNCDWKLRNLLKGYQVILKQRLEKSSSINEFMIEFKAIIENQLSSRANGSSELQAPKFYKQLLSEIKEIGWEKLAFIDQKFEELNFTAVDAKSRHHTLKIKLSPQHPEKSPDFIVELPQNQDFAWSRQTSLGDVYKQFIKFLDIYQDFWDVLDEIDHKTWVLEPEKPTRSATSRRIALGNTASVQINVNPTHPRMLPECRFLGADQVIKPLRENLNENLESWNENLTLLTNLEMVLDTSFPNPTNTNKEEFNVACGICYAYHLDEQIPDQACNDQRCGQPFHHSCLLEWLRSLPSSRQSFNVVFGECPYCSKPITVKILKR